ncbi:hypothetical protein IGI04_026063 [Brassica rapa subsp. trilocularis]|uniref:Uncharacterized protein n=1 Tax=Brassica rapa subsp. trilocularis TaxID=1813537 RepID=A0ABQ7KXI2_BRACM|nr:hypothetical protein IGI04_026063 [Brassica rapa subsp. trilocularis]
MVRESRSCFVRAVKVHLAFLQVSSEPVAKMRLTSMSDCYRAGTLGVLFLSRGDRFWMGVRKLAVCYIGVTLGVSVQTADIETLGAIYIDCGVPVMLGGPIGSETHGISWWPLTETFWDNKALPEQPQIATMKEKPSHHPKREIRAHQTRFGGTEERSIKYEYSKLNFEVMFYTHRSMCIRKQIVIWNFYLRVMVVSLGLIFTDRIREQSTSSARYHWKDLDASFVDHLSDSQIYNKAVELQRQFRPVSLILLSIISCKRIVIPSYFLRVMHVFARCAGAVCVYDQPGDEATLVKQMVFDRIKLGVYEQRTYRTTF